MEILAVAALILSVLSAAGVALLISKREDHANVESKIRTIELELADLVDRLSVWQRRDAARQRRLPGGTPDELGGPQPVQHQLGLVPTGKDQLRAAARAKGLIR